MTVCFLPLTDFKRRRVCSLLLSHVFRAGLTEAERQGLLRSEASRSGDAKEKHERRSPAFRLRRLRGAISADGRRRSRSLTHRTRDVGPRLAVARLLFAGHPHARLAALVGLDFEAAAGTKTLR